MLRRIAVLFGGPLLAIRVIGVIGMTFGTGMRRKAPVILDAVRRTRRAKKRLAPPVLDPA